MASLYDVALMAGVSKSTVSRVINNESGVKPETKIKVQQAVAESGYVVNQIAKDLKSSTTNLIGIIVPRISSHAIYRGVEGLTREFNQAGKQVLLGNSELHPGKELDYIALFNQKRVEGIIIFATHINEDLINAIRQSQATVVLIGQDGARHGIPSIIHDDYQVGYSAAEKLIAQGCRQLGFLGVHSIDIAVDQQRYCGFSDATQQHLKQMPCFHQQGEFTIASGYKEMTSVIASNISFDGLLCATDKIAIGAMQAIAAVGKIPGQDVYIIGVGNDEMSAVVTPSLSTFDLSFVEAGERAATMLLELIYTNSKQGRVNKIVLAFDWVARASCAA